MESIGKPWKPQPPSGSLTVSWSMAWGNQPLPSRRVTSGWQKSGISGTAPHHGDFTNGSAGVIHGTGNRMGGEWGNVHVLNPIVHHPEYDVEWVLKTPQTPSFTVGFALKESTFEGRILKYEKYINTYRGCVFGVFQGAAISATQLVGFKVGSLANGKTTYICEYRYISVIYSIYLSRTYLFWSFLDNYIDQQI